MQKLATSNHSATTAIGQRLMILEALKKGPKTSDELRCMGAYSSNSRIAELRKAGHEIITNFVDTFDRDGYRRRLALYQLEGEPC
ncbi:MAG: helix-turn-helix domain-containing protein [Comamonas sp.]